MAVLEQRDLVPVAALILAAGASVRMGRTKQLLPYRDAPLLQAAIDAAAASDVIEIIVVLGHRADEIRSAVAMPPVKPLRFVVCEDYASGQAASLACGLRAAADNVDAVAVLLGDQPDIEAGAVNRVVSAWRAAFEPVVRPIFLSETGMRTPGHPVVMERSVWEALGGQVGDDGAREWLGAHPEYVREIEIIASAPSDVDTWEDYLRIAKRRDRDG